MWPHALHTPSLVQKRICIEKIECSIQKIANENDGSGHWREEKDSQVSISPAFSIATLRAVAILSANTRFFFLFCFSLPCSLSISPNVRFTLRALVQQLNQAHKTCVFGCFFCSLLSFIQTTTSISCAFVCSLSVISNAFDCHASRQHILLTLSIHVRFFRHNKVVHIWFGKINCQMRLLKSADKKNGEMGNSFGINVHRMSVRCTCATNHNPVESAGVAIHYKTRNEKNTLLLKMKIFFLFQLALVAESVVLYSTLHCIHFTFDFYHSFHSIYVLKANLLPSSHYTICSFVSLLRDTSSRLKFLPALHQI